MLDVTDAALIAAAAETVAKSVGQTGLAGLVNNAGIAVAGPLEALPIDALRRQLEVNVIGQVAVTQAFLPLLRLARGRVVNMSSINGGVAVPYMGRIPPRSSPWKRSPMFCEWNFGRSASAFQPSSRQPSPRPSGRNRSPRPTESRQASRPRYSPFTNPIWQRCKR